MTISTSMHSKKMPCANHPSVSYQVQSNSLHVFPSPLYAQSVSFYFHGRIVLYLSFIDISTTLKLCEDKVIKNLSIPTSPFSPFRFLGHYIAHFCTK